MTDLLSSKTPTGTSPHHTPAPSTSSNHRSHSRSHTPHQAASTFSNASNTSNTRTQSNLHAWNPQGRGAPQWNPQARHTGNTATQAISNHQAARNTLGQILSSTNIDNITHEQAKEVIYALGVSKKLYAEAHRDQVRDTIVNSVVKQFAALPTRFVKYTLLSPAFLGAKPTLSNPPIEAERVALKEYQAHHKMLTYAGQHIRGTSHFLMNTLASPLDLSSGARSLPPRPFHKDSELKKNIVDKLNTAIESYDTLLSKNDPNLGLNLNEAAIKKARAELAGIKEKLQERVDQLLEDKDLCHPEEGETIDTLLVGIAEIVDTIGKVVIDVTLRATGTAAGKTLSAAGVAQLWSLVSYPTMDGISAAIHNWRDANALARIALKQYERFAAASPNHTVSDKEMQELADYVQSHFESKDVANHNRRLKNIFEPKLLEMSTEIVKKETKLKNAQLRIDTNSLEELDLVNQKIEKQDKIYRKMGEMDIDAEEYFGSINIVDMMTNYIQNGKPEGTQDISALIAFNIDSLLTVYCMPTPEASQYVEKFEAALQQFYEKEHLKEFEEYYQSKNINPKLKNKGAHKDFILQEFNQSHSPQKFDKEQLFTLFDTSIKNNLEKYKPIKRQDYKHRPGENSYSAEGLKKQAIFNKFTQLSINFDRLTDIYFLEKEVKRLDRRIESLHFNPQKAHDGTKERKKLKEEKAHYNKKITQYEKEIPLLRENARKYQADVKNYKDNNIDLIEDSGIKDAIRYSDTGAGAAFINHLKYKIFTTANRRKTLGIAMSISYDPSLGMMNMHPPGISMDDYLDPVKNISASTFFNTNTRAEIFDVGNLPAVLGIPIGAHMIQSASNGVNSRAYGVAGRQRPDLRNVQATILPEVRDGLTSNSRK